MNRHQIRSVGDLSARIPRGTRVLCLYSGGLDGTYLLSHMHRELALQGVALTVDLGQRPNSDALRSQASEFGFESLVIDRVEEFAEEFVRPAIAAHAVYLEAHPISASLSRPLIARVATEVAGEYGCSVILHTSTRTQNSLRRFNQSIADLGFEGLYGSPFEESGPSREAKRASLSALGLREVLDRSISIDENLWCREIECGPVDDPEAVDLDALPLTWTEIKGSSTAAVTVQFTSGRPSHLNGEASGTADLITRLNSLAGSLGLGRYVGLEETQDGIKVQEVREMPAACLLLEAYRRLESASLPAELIRVKLGLEQVWVREAVEGRWYGPLRESAQAFIEDAAARVSGEVAFDLAPHGIVLRALKAKNARYVRNRSGLETEPL